MLGGASLYEDNERWNYWQEIIVGYYQKVIKEEYIEATQQNLEEKEHRPMEAQIAH